ncbi:hypothetical protein TWF506_000012 [Arthrobotrys conoides]|uniref:Hydrophobin n=1 Tax=Arthrobotrys conoides TaxID=74498 RepID=A0AAN8NUM3_9PEZI
MMLASARHVIVIFFLLFTQASALFIPGLLKSLFAAQAPDLIKTSDRSPQCLAINQGKLLCCTAALSGGFPLVQEVSGAAGYTLPSDTLNGFLCTPSTTTTCPGTQLPLCCQVPQVSVTWGLWCQSALSSCSNP